MIGHSYESPTPCEWCGKLHDNAGVFCSDACEDKDFEYARSIERAFDEGQRNDQAPNDYIDKCQNCGRYKASETLTYPGQVCRKGCINPEEY